MRLTSKGQVTIPQSIREKLGLMPMTEVEFDIVGDSVRMRTLSPTTSNSTSVLGSRPSCSRMSWGMVTWPLTVSRMMYYSYQ